MEQTILTRLLEIMIYSTAIFLAVWLFRAVFSKLLSPQLKFALWFLVVLRLCIPVTFESGFHLLTVPAERALVSAAAPVNVDVAPRQASPQERAPALDGDADAREPQIDGTQSPVAAKRIQYLSWQQWLLIVWAAGFALALGISTTLMLQLRGRLVRHGSEPGERMLALYEDMKRQMQIRGRVALLLMPDITSPALTVEPFPRLLLPDRLVFAANAESMAFAMAHELMHFKRRDYLVCLLLLLLRAVYWFHPVSWALLHMMRLDMETACDSMVVARFDKDRKLSYVRLLLALGEDASHTSHNRKVV